jgi:hypothetical protein
MDVLRAGDGALLTTDAIAGRIIEAKAFDVADAALRKAVGEQALALLRSFRKRGTVEQIGLGRGVRWKAASLAGREFRDILLTGQGGVALPGDCGLP